MKQELNASKIFSALAVFDLITSQMHSVMWAVPRVISCKVSLDRINVFLNEVSYPDPKSLHPSPDKMTSNCLRPSF